MVKPSDILRLSNFFCCRHVASQAAPKSLVQLKSLELPEHASRGRLRSIDGDSGGHRLRWYTMGVQALRMFGRYPDDNTMYIYMISIYIWYTYMIYIYIYMIYDIWYIYLENPYHLLEHLSELSHLVGPVLAEIPVRSMASSKNFGCDDWDADPKQNHLKP